MGHIIKLLYQKGYRPFRDETGILVRETDQLVYIVILSIFRDEVRREDYENLRMRTEFMAASIYQKSVKVLHLIVTENGMFQENVLQLVENLENVWLIAADIGRIYIFENQPEQFDDLHNYLEQGLKDYFKEQADAAFTLKPVNMAIVALNIFCFLVTIISGDAMLEMGALSYETFVSGAWYEIITSLFIHFGISHLLNNMVLLTYAGCELEKRIGSFPYLILYLTAGICGNLVSLWYYHHIEQDTVFSAGASGAIFGVIGALIVILAVNHTETENLTSKRLIIMAGITIYYGMTTVDIDNAAHIGGMISGIISGFLLSKISQYGKLR